MGDDLVYVLNSCTLAGEWGTGSHLLAVPRIDVSRHSIRLGKTKRSKAFKSVLHGISWLNVRSARDDEILNRLSEIQAFWVPDIWPVGYGAVPFSAAVSYPPTARRTPAVGSMPYPPSPLGPAMPNWGPEAMHVNEATRM